MKTLYILALLLCATPLWAQNIRVWDATESYARGSEPTFKQVRPLEGALQWEGAPFLKLRPKDTVFLARRWHPNFKAEQGHLSKQESIFLRMGQRVIEVGRIEDGRSQLRDTSALIFFDWEVTLANATRLLHLHPSWDTALSLAQFQNLVKAVKPSFPGAIRDAATPQIVPIQLTGEGENRRAIFESLYYIAYSHTVEKRRTEIGRGLYRVTSRPLVVGPRRVERDEFDPASAKVLPNGQAYDYSPEAVAQARAAYREMQEFEAQIAKILPMSKLPNHRNR